MKQKLMRTPPQHKILEGESQKLKQKLDSLKKQIESKKKEKQISRSAQNNQPKLVQSRKSNNKFQTSEDLQKLLTNLKLDSIISKLKEKRIFTIDELDKVKAEQLQNWKDIAVGYRIKLKKYLSTKDINLQLSQKSSAFQTPEKSIQKVVEKKLNIQQIVKNRKQGQKYVAINRKNQQMQINNQKQLQQQQQDFMIQSLKTAFNFHHNKIKQHDQQVDKQCYLPQNKNEFHLLKYETPVQRVKSAVLQSRIQRYQNLPDYKYCWSCLKRIKEHLISHQNRQFCSEFCSQNYKQSVQIQNQINFFENIQHTEQKFEKHIYGRQMSGFQGESMNQYKKIKIIEVEVEELNFQIE